MLADTRQRVSVTQQNIQYLIQPRGPTLVSIYLNTFIPEYLPPTFHLPDIPSVLADSAVFNPDDGTGGGGFVVHWLNNKDLSFTSSMDLFMLQLRKFSEQQLEQTTEDPLDPEGSPMKFDFGMIHSWANVHILEYVFKAATCC